MSVSSGSAGHACEMSRLAAMRGVRLPTLALTVGLTVIGLASCGGSSAGLIPPINAAQINAALDQVGQNASNGNCDTAAAATGQVRAQINALPNTVDAKLKQNLTDGVDRLKQLTQDPKLCKAAPTPTVTQTTTVPAPTPTGPTNPTGSTGATGTTGTGGAGPG